VDNEKRELLAERLLEAGALEVRPGEEVPLRWNGAKALEDDALRELLTAALAELIRDHYSAADGVTGEEWAPILGMVLDLPVSGAGERPLVVLGSSGEVPKYLPALAELRKSGGSPAIAVVWNGREEELRLSLDRADIRCHWLTDLESGAAAALRKGLLDFADYCRLLPQD
jgi:hypothetical protein